MGIDWILFVLLALIWIGAGGLHWKGLGRGRAKHDR